MKNNFIVNLLLFSLITGMFLGFNACGEQTLDYEIADNQFNDLVEKYDLVYEVLPSALKEDVLKDQIVSIKDLELVLYNFKKLKGTSLIVEDDKLNRLSVPRLRSSAPEENDVITTCISGTNDELSATVCLDLKNGSVLSSNVNFRFPGSMYMNYIHEGGSYSINGEIVNFSAYGSVEVYIALEDIVVATYSVVMHGYYNLSTNKGELTFY